MFGIFLLLLAAAGGLGAFGVVNHKPWLLVAGIAVFIVTLIFGQVQMRRRYREPREYR
jgi:uncharacterized membrane protein YccC